MDLRYKLSAMSWQVRKGIATRLGFGTRPMPRSAISDVPILVIPLGYYESISDNSRFIHCDKYPANVFPLPGEYGRIGEFRILFSPPNKYVDSIAGVDAYFGSLGDT